MTQNKSIVYGVLAAILALVVIWETVEHQHARRAARAAMIIRAKDISITVSLVMRSQRRFGGIISKDRMESALNALVKPGDSLNDLTAIALLNAAGEVVASAGATTGQDFKQSALNAESWSGSTITVMNLVDLGTNMTREMDAPHTIVIPRRDMPQGPFGTNRPPPNAGSEGRPGPPPDFPPPPQNEPGYQEGTNSQSFSTNGPGSQPRRWGRDRGGENRPPLGRPFWMSEAEYKAAIEKQGVHSFAVVLSTKSTAEQLQRDLVMRGVICLLGGLAVLGMGLAWRNTIKSSELELRLVRASELNSHLKQMNLAAAGLAHETKNPLNIVRGLAQVISRREDAKEEIRRKALDIVEETDRVTAQLNEFINYSRPREVRLAQVSLGSVVSEVVRALNFDCEEKAVSLEVAQDLPTVRADEQLLRQAIFNLIINAIQAAPRQGRINVAFSHQQTGEGILDIVDNGPGVPPENRSEIFKPYFTTHHKGTGLGLAIVRQIILAHGWEIQCLANEPSGAIFRISHIRVATPS